MSVHHDLERRLADYYDSEAPRQAPDRVLHAALSSIDTTRQRRVLIRVPRRFDAMNMSARAVIAAAAVIAAGVFVLAVVGPLRPASSGPGALVTPSPSASAPAVPSPSVSPSSSPSPLATASPSPLGALGGTFTSEVFGVSTSYPAGWKIGPATELWTRQVSWACAQTCADLIFESEREGAFLSLASQPLGARSDAEWVAATLADPGWEGTCPPVTEPVSIDGTSGTIATICPEGLLVALTTSGGRGYAFVLYRVDDIGEFKKILATVRLHPEDAVDVMPSASPS